MEAKIKNMSIVTNEIHFSTNNLPLGSYQMVPNIKRRVGRLSTDSNKYGVELMVDIKDTPEQRFPLNLFVKITGIFEIDGENEEEINEFLKLQGVQMVYPYLRSLVSNITSSSLLQPIILPIINVLDFKEISDE